MMAIFDTLVYNPIYNVLIFLYNTLPGNDFGIAIIITTIVLKTVLLPLSRQQIESQKKMRELQPKIKALEAKYKDDKEKKTRAMLDLYKEHNFNPASGCLPLIIQITFFIALYRVFINISSASLQADGSILYSFIHNPGQIQNMFLGVVDLIKSNYVLAVLAAGSQYIQTKKMMEQLPQTEEKTKDAAQDFSQIMMKQMLFIGPLLTLIIGIQFPAGIALYMLTSSIFMIIQQEYMQKNLNSVKN